MFKPNDTKIQTNFTLGLILVLLFGLSFNFTSADATADQLNASQQKLLQINQQIKSYQQQIATTQSKTSSLKNEISIYNDQISSTELAIQAKQTQIDNANLQIKQLQGIIDQKIKILPMTKKF